MTVVDAVVFDMDGVLVDSEPLHTRAITLVLACAAVFILRNVVVVLESGPSTNIRGVWGAFPGALKRLLVSDVIVRTCESLSEIFIVLYVADVLGRHLARPAQDVVVGEQHGRGHGERCGRWTANTALSRRERTT